MKSKLDVSALFHCAMTNSKYINTFRITITLKEKIDEDILQQVVDQLIHQYPTICSRISKDFFWYYTKSLKSIKVQKDKDIFRLYSLAQSENPRPLYRTVFRYIQPLRKPSSIFR